MTYFKSANSCCCKSSLGHFVAPRTTPVKISYSLQPSPRRWSCHVESRRPIRGRDRDWANRWPDKQASCLALKTQCNACTKAISGHKPPWVVRLCKSSTHEALHRGQLSESHHSRHTKSLPWNVWRDWEYWFWQRLFLLKKTHSESSSMTSKSLWSSGCLQLASLRTITQELNHVIIAIEHICLWEKKYIQLRKRWLLFPILTLKIAVAAIPWCETTLEDFYPTWETHYTVREDQLTGYGHVPVYMT